MVFEWKDFRDEFGKEIGPEVVLIKLARLPIRVEWRVWVSNVYDTRGGLQWHVLNLQASACGGNGETNHFWISAEEVSIFKEAESNNGEK